MIINLFSAEICPGMFTIRYFHHLTPCPDYFPLSSQPLVSIVCSHNQIQDIKVALPSFVHALPNFFVNDKPPN